MKPLIGINLDVTPGPPQEARVQSNYFNAVIKAGGLPVLIPPMPEEDIDDILTKLNGILLIGGRDYNPALFGEAACPEVLQLSPQRQEFDLRLIQRTIARTDLPLLGLCAGEQALNIAMGGSLIQHIPTEIPKSTIKHASPDGWTKGFNYHKVELSPGSRLAKIYPGNEVLVCTSHHQAVKKLGKGLTAAAHAEDGVIEAVEMEGKPFVIGVQWHPERDFPTNQSLFENFVRAAAQVPVRAN